MEQRHEYVTYDTEHSDRERIAGKLRKKYPEMDFVIGGAVSMDIFNKGNDKSQVIPRYFEEALESNQIHYVFKKATWWSNHDHRRDARIG